MKNKRINLHRTRVNFYFRNHVYRRKYTGETISRFNIFATCAQVLLALATIYFTYTISEKQNRISKLEYAPLFVLDKGQLYTKDYIPTGSEKITITNEGYSVNNYSSDVESILTIYYSFGHKANSLVYKLDYFSVQSHKSGGKGEMTSGIGENNISKLLEIKRKTRKILENHYPDYFNFELQ